MDFEKITNGVWKLRIGVPEEHTPVAMRSFPMSEEALGKLREIGMPEMASHITYRQNHRGLQLFLPMNSDEDIYGFGLQLQSMNQAGRKRMLRVNSDPAADTGEGHAPVPFYASTAGYGLFLDTFRHVEFYMGTSLEKGRSGHRREVNQEHKEFSESALYALKRSRERRTVVIDLKAVSGVDCYFFAGNIMEVVQRYNLFSGGGCLPPMWGLGVWYRSYGGSDQEAICALAQGFRDDDMPVDVLGLEPGWHSHSYSCTYQWSYLFPQPAEMIERMKEQGFKLNLWEHLFVYPAAPFYEELLPYAGEYEVWNGLVPDFGTTQAEEIFTDYHRDTFVRKGICGFKLDECDNSDFNPSSWSFPDVAQFPSGMDGEQMHAAIGGMYQKLIYNAFHGENRRTYSQVRSSGALSSPLPFVLYSDLYNHKQFIRGMVTAGFSGLLWAPEVRSCSDGNDLLRRMETIMFSAHAIYNCWRIPNPPWKQVDIEKNLSGEFMEDADYYTRVCRKYHKVRMSLLPYLYSAFVKYYKEGVPPVRALVMDYEEDSSVRNVDDEYMFGNNLLVAPMTVEDGIERSVYLPVGKWYDFWDNTVYEGGQRYQIQADYDKIPVFVKDQCILPLADPVDYVVSEMIFDIHPRVYGDGGEGCILYEDDFESFAYEQGRQNEVRLSLNANGQMQVYRSGEEKIRYRIFYKTITPSGRNAT